MDGMLTLNDDGSFQYSPYFGFAGTDSFTYYANDGILDGNIATVTITVTAGGGGGSNNAPMAAADYYTVNCDTLSPSVPGVLANDFDQDGDPLTAVLVDDVSNGTLSFNADGAFTYTPAAGFEGNDSFTYYANDGTDNSSTETVTLDVTKPFGPQTNLPDQPVGGTSTQGAFATSRQTGDVFVSHSVGSGHALLYRATANGQPIVAVETTFSDINGMPDQIEARLTLGGVSVDPIFYDGSTLMSGSDVRFVIQADVSSLATGRYAWQLDVISHYGSDTATQSFTGYQDVLNLNGSDFGSGWTVADLDRLAGGSGGMLLVNGSGVTAWFADNGDGTFSSPAGLLSSSSLVQNADNTYTLTSKHGNRSEFDANGLLTARVDSNGNTISYAYVDADSDGQTDELSQITDPFGRVTTFAYSAGLLVSVTDIAGRTTSVTHDGSGRVISITAPDPDDAGPGGAAVTSYTYNASGLLSDITDPLSRTTQLQYDFAGRLTQSTDPLGNSRQFEPIQTEGLVDTASGVGTSSNPGSFDQAYMMDATWTDPLGNQDTYAVDRFGNVIEYTNALGYVVTYERDADGRVTKLTQPDPDGAGPLSSPVTTYSYDSNGNLTGITLPDGSTASSVYDATLNRPTSSTDQMGRVTTYAYDASGNRTSTTDPLGNVTTYAYNASGFVTSIMLPDPDGAGSQTAPVTSFAYDSFGRLTTTTNPDGTTQQFVHDAADNLTSTTDELGRVAASTYDNLDRLLSVTAPDPDDGGPLAAPVSTFDYDAAGRLLTKTDPAANVTSYLYDDLDQVLSVTLPDPDGAGPLAAPVTSSTYDAAGNRQTQADPLGNVTTFDYNGAGWLVVSITFPDPDLMGPQQSPVLSYDYDNMGRRTKVTDPLGNVTTSAYDSLDRVTSVTDALGNVTSTTFDAAGNRLSVTDRLGNVSTLAYDALNRLTSATQPDPDGAGPLSAPVTTFAYDNLGRQTSVTDPLGNVTNVEYDSRSRMTKRTDADPDGAGPLTAPVTTWSYDGASQALGVTDALGRVISYEYDGLGRRTKTTLPDPDVAGPETSPVYTTTYDILGNVQTETDPLGNATQFEYDNLSRLTKMTQADPDGAGPETSPVTTYTYDVASYLTGVTDPLNRSISYDYDNLGRLIEVTLPDPDGAGSATAPILTTAYDTASNVTKETDPNGNETQFEYNELNRLTKVTGADPDGAGPLSSPVTTYVYDAASQLTSVTDPENRTTSYEYDQLGRRTKTTLPDPDDAGPQTGAVHTTGYDAVGNVVSQTDPLNQTTQYVYDNLYRPSSVTDPNGGVTGFEHDAVGNRTKLTDPVGNATIWVYDDLNRISSETNALNDTRSFSYDAASNLTSRTDRNGRVIEFDYDNLHRKTEERWKDGTTVVETISYSFDAVSQLTSASDSRSAYAYTFDNLGRVTTVDNAGTTGSPNVVLTNTFDAAGNRIGVSATIDGTADFKNTSQFDALNRMTRLEQTGQTGGNSVADKRVDLSYKADGRFGTIARYEDAAATLLVATTAYSWDGAGRLTNLDHTKGTTNLANYSWTFDSANRVTQFSSPDGTSDYTYDSTGQLTGATHSFQTDESYAFDANGNRTNTGYQTGTNNQLLSDGTYDYLYDAEGNRTKKTDISTGDWVEYSWDHRNRLTNLTFKDSQGAVTKTAEYTYDVSNRRIAKSVDENGDGSIDRAERYIYDRSGKSDPATGVPLDDIVLIYEDADGDGPGPSTLGPRLLHGPAADQVFAQETASGQVFWALADNQGTVRDVAQYDESTDETTIVEHIRYDSFGNVTAVEDASGQPSTLDSGPWTLFFYTGREWDPDADLYYYRARWYDPAVGRFISEDPLGFLAGDTHIQRYVGNSPVDFRDPSGLAEWVWPWDDNASWNPLDTAQTWTDMGTDLVYTGDISASDEVSQDAMEAAGESYTENAGLAHQALDAVGPYGQVVSTVLESAEGELLHDQVMDGVPNEMWAGEFEQQPLPNPNLPLNQQVLMFIRDWADEIIVVAMVLEAIVDVSAMDPNCFVAGTQVLMSDPKRHTIASVESVEALHSETDLQWTTILMAAACIPIARAGRRLPRRKKRNRKETDIDEIFANDDILGTEEGNDPSQTNHEDQDIADRSPSLSPGELDTVRPPQMRESRQTSKSGSTKSRSTQAAGSERPSGGRISFRLAWLVAWLALGTGLLFHGLGGHTSDLEQPALAAMASSSDTTSTIATKNIEDIRPGDYVLSRNPETGEVGPRRVLEAFQRSSRHLRILRIRSANGELQELKTTDEHPFWVDGTGWVDAGKLLKGQHVRQTDGKRAFVVATRREEHPNGVPVFNLKIEGWHTYFVAAQGSRATPVFVHNADCYEFAQDVLDETGSGEIRNLRPIPDSPADGRVIPNPPGYPPEHDPFFGHGFHLDDGVVTDPENQGGIPYDEWYEQLIQNAVSDGFITDPEDFDTFYEIVPWDGTGPM